jgi:hypothetical protein
MADVAATKERVQAYLTSVGPVQIDSDGDYSVARGSTRAFVRVLEHPNGEMTYVNVFALVLRDVPLTPALYEYVATEGAYIFGHLELKKGDDGKGLLIFSHRLLGDYLDQDELMYAVFGVSGTADELDDELQKMFGGSRFAD